MNLTQDGQTPPVVSGTIKTSTFTSPGWRRAPGIGAKQVTDTLEGTPCCWVVFDGATTYITVTKNATIDDLPGSGDVTWEGYYYPLSKGEGGFGHFLSKGENAVGGYRFIFNNNDGFILNQVDHVTTVINWVANMGGSISGAWHHIAWIYLNASKTLQLWLDGALIGTSPAGVGNYVADNGWDLIYGAKRTLTNSFDGYYGWQRISDTARYTAPGPFTPPERCVMPAVDGNTVELWHYDEGSGATVAAEVSSPTNDGTITLGSWGCE